MLNRLWRILATFAIVVGCYLVYALAAVPLIEPSTDARHEHRATAADVERARRAYERQRAELAAWFGPGDWELATPKILENAQGMLLLKDYHNRGDGKVEIKPCTMILLPEGQFASEAERRRRAVLVRCPEGAVLQFDAPFDLKQARIGRLIGGQLRGAITIHSQQRDLGPDDDVLIHTRDITLTEQRIQTPHPVDFRMGPHQGRGRRLTILLAQGRGAGRGAPAGKLSPSALETLELAEAVEARLQPGRGGFFPGSGPPGPAAQPPQPPVEISCRGPFRFDFLHRAASFTKQVEVVRLNPAGPADQMSCQVLNVYFEPQSPAAAAPRLQPARLEAFGNPVLLRSSANGVDAQAQQLEYDMKLGAATLRDASQAWVRQGQREIHSREIFFQPDESRRLGEFTASGPGWLQGALPDDPAQRLQARWSRRLHFRPLEQQHLLSLEGAAHVHAIGRGTLDGEELHIWLSEVPAADGAGPHNARKVELVPDRVLATGQVKIDAPQLTAAVAQLQMWFERPAAAGGPAPPPAPPPPSRAVSGAPVATPAPAAAPAPASLPTVPPAAAAAASEPAPQPPPEPLPPAPAASAPVQTFHVVGEQLKVRARAVGPVTELAEVIVEYNVELTETQTPQPGEKPLVVRGQLVHVVQPSPGAAVVRVSGKPGYIEARGLSLASASIHLDRGANLLWTDGPGTLTMLVDRDLQGAAVAQPQPLAIDWQGTMRFDGATARFQRDVAARQAAHLVRTDLMDVTLSRPVRFDAPAAPRGAAHSRPQIDRVVCHNGVFLESRTWAGPQLASIDQLQAATLTVEGESGRLDAAGPGQVTTVRVENGQSGSPLGLGPRGGPRREPPAAAPGLAFRSVRFQRQLTGNLRRREMTFQGQVQGVFGPVPDWHERLDPDRPNTWGEQGAALTCDQLEFAELPGSSADQRLFELAATGNTLVETAHYTARAARLTYTQSKGLLVLEGNGRGDARLFRQTAPGAAPSEAAARKIWYWPATNQVEVDEARFLDLHNLPR